VNSFFRRAEEILEIATTGGAALGDTLMVLDRQGGLRMLEPAGWSLSALAAEFGAEAVYKVERRGSSVRVEGWNGSERCLLQGRTGAQRMLSLLGAPFTAQATMLQLTSLALA
jgi:CelD/BcsL family acetyltransferase involved in cellulose biosynthesis